jgi:acyl dehydratase
MPISEAHTGRSYPPTPPYEITAVKIAEFATALGDQNPAYYGDTPVAPPTFAAVLAARAWDSMFVDPELGLDLHRIVHGDQRFTYRRSLRAGDRIAATLTIEKVRLRGAAVIISSVVDLHDVAGDLACTAATTFIQSEEAA